VTRTFKRFACTDGLTCAVRSEGFSMPRMRGGLRHAPRGPRAYACLACDGGSAGRVRAGALNVPRKRLGFWACLVRDEDFGKPRMPREGLRRASRGARAFSCLAHNDDLTCPVRSGGFNLRRA
jgi:hypothetical protein